MITDQELRTNHQFVTAFERLRKQFGHREMHDLALQDIAARTGLTYEDLRVARHLRNALAHDNPVNREAVARHLELLTAAQTLAVRGERPTFVNGTSPDRRAFRIHAWKDRRLEQEMVANGFVSLGGEEIGDLTNVAGPEIIRSALVATMADRTTRAIGLFVGYWRRFLWEAAEGDVIVLPTQELGLVIGEFVGPYYYVDAAEAKIRHRREVAWYGYGIDREDIGKDLLVTISGRHSVQEFKAVDAAKRLQAIAETGSDPGS